MSGLGIKGHRNNHRRFPGVKGRRPDNKKFRQEEAVARQEAYDKLSTEEKLQLIDMKLGKGLGAKKQRARLAKDK